MPKFVPEGYEVLSRLGSGQTALVYLARHSVFGEVALKLPRAELAQRPVLKKMFENEVAITTKLASPNVVTAFEGFPTGAGAFLALEYCSGGTLDQHLLEKGRMPLERCYRFVLDVAAGLAHTHERQILHRDVKPANVFLTASGDAKLGDFGTGVFMGDDGEERVGTAFYMAPEVFEGNSAGVRSDIYSLGVLAYEVIAGERPFVGASYDALMVAHRTSAPKDLRALRPGLAIEVVRVVSHAMMRDPARRYESARDFATALAKATGSDASAFSTGEQAVEQAPEPTTGRSSRKTGETDPPTSGRRRDGSRAGASDKPFEEDRKPAQDKRPAKRGIFGWFRRSRD
ncbi:MAG: serine/threonine-protein kinase [Truepera sp.]|nr:serine/threonine-protein kinase [Truepera sp.]